MPRFCGAMLLLFLLFAQSVVIGQAGPAAGLGVNGSGPFVLQQDPKYPGKPLWKIWAREVSGGALESGSGFQGTLLGVKAYLFQKGKLAAILTAPKATGNNVEKMIMASGRVKIISKTQSGTSLEADTVTWYAAKNQIIATGHVVYISGGPAPGYFYVPVLYADTALKTIHSSGPGQGKFPKGL